MSARAEELARRVEQGAAELIAAVEGFSAAEWSTMCPGEQRSVGVLVCHVGAAYPNEAVNITALASEGGMPGLTWDVVKQYNREEANHHARVDKAAAIALVRENVATASDHPHRHPFRLRGDPLPLREIVRLIGQDREDQFLALASQRGHVIVARTVCRDRCGVGPPCQHRFPLQCVGGSETLVGV